MQYLDKKYQLHKYRSIPISTLVSILSIFGSIRPPLVHAKQTVATGATEALFLISRCTVGWVWDRICLTGQYGVTSLRVGAGVGTGQQVSVDTAAEQVVIPGSMESGRGRTNQMSFTSSYTFLRAERLRSAPPSIQFWKRTWLYVKCNWQAATR